MIVHERISLGVTGEDKDCEPLTADEFAKMLDEDDTNFSPREIRLMSTMLLYIEGGRQTHDQLRGEIEQLKARLEVNHV